MKIYNDITELIGNTPIVKIGRDKERQAGQEEQSANVFLKLEYYNPAGSVKDRVALNMILEAEKSGSLKKGGTIVEPTSGNTGIGICAVAAALGYKAVIVMPETMSEERKKIIKLYGAELVLSDGAKGMAGAIQKAEEICEELEDAIILGQFINEANPEAHKRTAEEIWDDMGGNLDVVVCGVGTGGSITGIGKELKKRNKDIVMIAVEPSDSAVLSGEEKGAHKIQGIGAGFVPEILDTKIYDEIVKVKNEEAFEELRNIARDEGILLGISSGAAIFAAKKLAMRHEFKGKNILAICPDTGERYLSVL